MAVSVFKTFSAGETLTAADLNSSFTQITGNGEDLGWPATKAKDLDGQELILDSDADTSITADTDDLIDFRIGGTDGIKFGFQNIADGSYVDIDPEAHTLDSAESFHRVNIGGTNALTQTGTTANISSLRIVEPNITESGTVTKAQTLLIPSVPTEGTTNYSIHTAGSPHFDGWRRCHVDSDGTSVKAGSVGIASSAATSTGVRTLTLDATINDADTSVQVASSGVSAGGVIADARATDTSSIVVELQTDAGAAINVDFSVLIFDEDGK